MKLYTVKQVRKAKVDIDSAPIEIPYAGFFFLRNFTGSKEGLIDVLFNDQWKQIAEECLTDCIISLFLKDKIEATYYMNKKIYPFRIHSKIEEGFQIFIKTPNIEEKDLLSKTFLSLSKEHSDKNNKIDIFNIISLTIATYKGIGQTDRAHKKFISAFLEKASEKINWIQFESTKKLLSPINNYSVKLEEDKKTEIEKSYQSYQQILMKYSEENFLFKKFYAHVQHIVAKVFEELVPSD